MTVSTSIWDSGIAGLTALKTYLGGDTKQNMVPVVSDTYNLGADDWNVIVAGLAEVADRMREPQVGEGYVTSSVSDTVVTGGTYVELGDGSTWDDGELDEFTRADNVFTYTGTPTRKFFAVATMSVYPTAGASDGLYNFGFGTGASTIIASTVVQAQLANATGAVAVTIAGVVELATSETLRVLVTSDANGDIVIADQLHVVIKGL